MSYRRERDYFMAQVAPTLGVPNARALLACATTLQRLAEAQCNGDWPAEGRWACPEPGDVRQTSECSLCGRYWASSQIQGGSLAKIAYALHVGWNIRDANNITKEAGTKACPDCRAEARAQSLVEGSPYQAVTQGDPRGAVLSLYERSASRESIENGTARRIYVPTR